MQRSQTLPGAGTLIGAALLLSACGPGGSGGPPGTWTGPVNACTEIGCNSTVEFKLALELTKDAAYDIEACIEDECHTATLTAAENAAGDGLGALSLTAQRDRIILRLPQNLELSTEQRVRLSVVDGSGDVVAAVDTTTGFEPNQPNGPGCPPTCWYAVVRL